MREMQQTAILAAMALACASGALAGVDVVGKVEGTVKGYIPLRNRRAGMVTHIGEAMTEYRCEGRVALGISEYLDQVE